MNKDYELLSSSDLFDYYKVINGDPLSKIASDNNINPTLLSELNGLNINDYIYQDQVLLVPKAGCILYFTTTGDTLNGLIEGMNANIDTLLKQNPNIFLQPEQLIAYKYK